MPKNYTLKCEPANFGMVEQDLGQAAELKMFYMELEDTRCALIVEKNLDAARVVVAKQLLAMPGVGPVLHLREATEYDITLVRERGGVVPGEGA